MCRKMAVLAVLVMAAMGWTCSAWAEGGASIAAAPPVV